VNERERGGGRGNGVKNDDQDGEEEEVGDNVVSLI
jgi:hypothetical protein